MWRDTGTPIRFLFCDAGVTLPLLLFCFHIAWWTLYVAVAGVIVFAVVNRLGLTVPAALRALRCLANGSCRPAVPASKRRGYA